ncbi:hypothetical protein IAR50_006692 [Cryptococcus sp. DSM 104548]
MSQEEASREGLDEQIAEGDIPGLFHLITIQSEFEMKDLEPHSEGWSFQPQPTNEGLVLSQDETAANNALSRSRAHHNTRRMRLNLEDPILPQSTLNGDSEVDEYEAHGICTIEFEIPRDHPSVQFRVSPGSEENSSEVIDVIDFPDDAPVGIETTVTCFHHSTLPFSSGATDNESVVHHLAEVYVSQEPMTVFTNLTSGKKLFDYVDDQILNGQEIRNGRSMMEQVSAGKPGLLPLFAAGSSSRLEGSLLYNAEIALWRKNRSGTLYSYRGRASYDPSIKTLTRPDTVDELSFATIERFKPDLVDGALFLVSERAAMSSLDESGQEEVEGEEEIII